MDPTFEVVPPNEQHPEHYLVVAVFESGERLDFIGFKDARAAKVIADKLRVIYSNCQKKVE